MENQETEHDLPEESDSFRLTPKWVYKRWRPDKGRGSIGDTMFNMYQFILGRSHAVPSNNPEQKWAGYWKWSGNAAILAEKFKLSNRRAEEILQRLKALRLIKPCCVPGSTGKYDIIVYKNPSEPPRGEVCAEPATENPIEVRAESGEVCAESGEVRAEEYALRPASENPAEVRAESGEVRADDRAEPASRNGEKSAPLTAPLVSIDTPGNSLCSTKMSPCDGSVRNWGFAPWLSSLSKKDGEIVNILLSFAKNLPNIQNPHGWARKYLPFFNGDVERGQNFSPAVVRRACDEWGKYMDFVPSPGDLLEECRHYDK